MRILNKKLTLLAALALSIGFQAHAMEYGDRPATAATASWLTSWLYGQLTPTKVQTAAIGGVLLATLLKEQPAVGAPIKISPPRIPAVTLQLPESDTSKKIALYVGLGALCFWGGKKIYNWYRTSKTEGGHHVVSN